MTCKEITELATEYAEGHLAEAERDRFMRHLAGCHGCAAWVRQLEVASRALRGQPEPVLPAALQADLQARFEAWASARATTGAGRTARAPGRAGWRLRWAPALGIAVTFGLLVGLARSPSGLPLDWVVAVGLVAVAGALVVAWRRVTAGLAAIAASSALLAAVLTGGRGPLDGPGGLECLLTVWGVAALTAGVARAALRRELPEQLRPAMGVTAVAGALAAVAALQVGCGAHPSLAHLLAFHVGGLLAVLALALLAAGRPLSPPTRSAT